ncbi:MAG: BatD family protein [Prevotella sp.]|nr:BatD family protein [Prevotella sp.]
MRRYYSILLTLFAVTITATAQKLVAGAPSHVSVGEQFRLTYTINTQDVDNFRAGNFPDAFEVLMGPSTSRQSSFQMVNGHTTSSSSITFTYIVCANKNGTFTIPPAQIRCDGKVVKSNSVKINVSGRQQAQRGGGGGGYDDEPQMRPSGSHISGSDLFIKVSANKQRVHEQEPILLTYKVYTLVQLTRLDGKMPDLKGFHTQEVQLPQQKSFKVETYNGRPYRTVTWSQYVMFPQMTGKLEIPSITFDGTVVMQNRDIDPFEAFFNGGSGYVEMKKKIKAPGITIQVDPLPNRPADFSGGVGKFNISAQLTPASIKTNDAVTLRVIVSGVGNLKLIKEPVVVFPKDFDRYDAKVTDKTKLTANGVEGSMIYDFIVVPRNAGKYEIPPVKFVYYDTSTNKYATIESKGFSLNVAQGAKGGGVSDFTGQDVDLLNKDIRHIKTTPEELHGVNEFFFGSTSYWVTLALLAIAFISLFVIFRQRAIDNANIGKMRGKKANKVATKRLRVANKLMTAGRSSEFYDEVLRALWGYVGDKLNMPVESLSRENISQRLSEREVSEANVKLFISALDECEFERYAPGDAKGNMNKTFNAAMTAIENIEDTMKKRKKVKTAGLGLLLLVVCIAIPSAAQAQKSAAPVHVTKAMGDSAYVRQQYQQAIADYEALLKKGVSADVYYNLGNAYYRTDNITRAVINYERALLLSPGDPDIRVNLQLARSKTIDKIIPESEMFFVTWYRSLVNIMSVDGWATMSLVSLAIAIILALCYLFSGRVWMQKTGFFGALAMIVIFGLSNLFAWQQKDQLVNRTGAIVISPAAAVKSTPANGGTDLFIIHEGTKVEITDSSMKEWKEVRIADGKEGWIKASMIEMI